MKYGIAALACLAALAGCGDGNDAAEDKLERDAEAQAAAAGPVEAALGLSEAQLLDAELIGPGNAELGDVARVERGADGKVDRLLIEIEDSNPDRFVHVPLAGLKPVVNNDPRAGERLAGSQTADAVSG
jgi:hypothetical protein